MTVLPASISTGPHEDLLEEAARDIAALDGGPEAVVVGVRTASGKVSLASAGKWRTRSEHQGPVPLEAVFDLASVSKVLGTTAALLSLSSEIDLDSPLTHYVPHAGLPASVTVRHLLLHRGGLWEWQPLYLTPGDPLDVLDTLPPRYPVDTVRHYSDLGFMHLGRLVAEVSGMEYARAVQELVLNPSGMDRTTVGRADEVLAVPSSLGDAAERGMVEREDPYPIIVRPRRTEMGWRHELVRGAPNDGNAFHARMLGHAGLFAPVEDMLRGAATLMGDLHSVVSLAPHQTLAQWRTPGPDPLQALGWRREVFSGVDLAWHPGFTGCAVGVGEHMTVALGSNRLLGVGGSAPRPTVQLWRQLIARLVEEGVLTGGMR